MSATISFSYFSRCYVYLLVVLSLSSLCSSNRKFDDVEVLCIDSEKQALLEFKHGLIDEAGRLASWDEEEERDCCKWAGIGCDNITGHVHRIHLRALDGHCDLDMITYEEDIKQRLKGNLSSSLINLKQLRHLDLSCNDFGGIKVPKFIGSLRNLRYLNLSVSKFGGSIPPQLGNLSELRVLSLGIFYVTANYERTNISNIRWLSSLRRLQHLDMSSLNLSKANDWIQVIDTFPSLIELHLSGCGLSDIHPHFITSNLTSLSVLDLSYNTFNSSMPPWIFGITSLVSLDLSWSLLRGLIPSSVGFGNLTSLKSLDISGNGFMNSSSVLKGLSSVGGNLISLDISFCHVTSLVFDSLHNLTALRTLDLSFNQLTKPLPKSLGNFCNLREINLGHNLFSNITLISLFESFFVCKSPHLESFSLEFSDIYGHLPGQLGQLVNLVHLILHDNNVVGIIPDSIGQLSFLRTLLLQSNKISGRIPYSIGRLSSLEELYLSHNQLDGSLPVSIFGLSSLKLLYISNNRLTGSLPDSLGQLSKLEELSFSYNLMTGVVTEAHFTKLASLNYLNGSGNNLTLRPGFANWNPPFQLRFLYLNSWSLGSQFPSWLRLQRDLMELDISNTQIHSPLSVTFWRSFPNLVYLDMSQNHIQGTLLDIPATLRILDLSSNKLSGKLPNFSNGMKQIESLNLGNNRFSGVIPECWEKSVYLEFLNLENNNLSGGIPTTLGFLRYLRSLNMLGNKLSGRLPSSLMNLTNLNILQLGKNRFVGSIPTWLGRKLSFLRILSLRSNNFDGNIPRELCYLSYIQILDLADNKLSGNIPRCFNNYKVLSGKETFSDYIFTMFILWYGEGYTREALVMKQRNNTYITVIPLVLKGREDMYSTILRLVMLLDLSSNNLVGHIPNELTTLKALHSLNLSRNQLTGRIPEKIGDLKSLESFDISLNMLSGEFPSSLSSLNFLSSFNVSYNNLTGRIPSSTQLQTFTESSFFGNKLCGAPLITEPCVVKSPDTEHQKEADGSPEADWGLIISILFGWVAGFWIIVAPLIVCRSWRVAYFRFLSEMTYMVYDLMRKYCFKHVF